MILNTGTNGYMGRHLFNVFDLNDKNMSEFISEMTSKGEWDKWKFSKALSDAGGLGRDRTGDLTIFSRSLVPTELPSQSNLFITTYFF